MLGEARLAGLVPKTWQPGVAGHEFGKTESNMIAPINPITLADPALSIQSPSTFPASGAESNGGGGFKTMLDSAVNAVQGSQNNANTAIENFLNGNTEDVHSTVLAVQRADLTFQMFMQLRNKVVSAYQEVMKMQV